jgi:hypothetical protein
MISTVLMGVHAFLGFCEMQAVPMIGKVEDRVNRTLREGQPSLRERWMASL